MKIEDKIDNIVDDIQMCSNKINKSNANISKIIEKQKELLECLKSLDIKNERLKKLKELNLKSD